MLFTIKYGMPCAKYKVGTHAHGDMFFVWFMIFAVQLLAGRIEGIGFTVQTVQIILISHDTISVLVKDRNFPKLVMLENQVLQRSAIVGTLTCDML